MKKWFSRLGKTAQTAVIVGAILAVLSISAIAAWQLTKTGEAHGEILGTFLIEVGTCTGCIPGSSASCALPIVNETDGEIVVDNTVTITTETEGITTSIIRLGGLALPRPIPAGETADLTWNYAAPETAPKGPVLFTVTVTASQD